MNYQPRGEHFDCPGIVFASMEEAGFYANQLFGGGEWILLRVEDDPTYRMVTEDDGTCVLERIVPPEEPCPTCLGHGYLDGVEQCECGLLNGWDALAGRFTRELLRGDLYAKHVAILLIEQRPEKETLTQ